MSNDSYISLVKEFVVFFEAHNKAHNISYSEKSLRLGRVSGDDVDDIYGYETPYEDLWLFLDTNCGLDFLDKNLD